MSLPWRFSTVEDYVEGTIRNLHLQLHRVGENESIEKDDDGHDNSTIRNHNPLLRSSTNSRGGRTIILGDHPSRTTTTTTRMMMFKPHLTIGKYYLHGSDLQTHHVIRILEEAISTYPPRPTADTTSDSFCPKSPGTLEVTHSFSSSRNSIPNSVINEISFSGVTLLQDVLPSLIQMFTKYKYFKRMSLNDCTGYGIVALGGSNEDNGGGEEEEQVAFVPVVDCICIANCQMMSRDLKALGRHMCLNNNLIQLELFELKFEENIFSPSTGEQQYDDDTMVLAQFSVALQTTTSLKVLEFSHCTFNDNVIEAVAEGLRDNQSIESFFIPGCELDDDQIAMLMESLSHHPTLSCIKLFRNYCGSNGTSNIANMMGSVDIDESEMPTVHEGITDSYHSCLHLNNIKKKITRRTKLKSLDLSYQHFERADKLDITMISKSLATSNSMLVTLKLAFNKLNDDDAKILASGFQPSETQQRPNSSSSCCCCTLQELDLRSNNIRNEGIVAIAEKIITTSTSLQKLFLFGNPISINGANAWLKAISDHNTILEVLNIDYSTLWYTQIQFYTYLNRAGRRLLSSRQIGNDHNNTIVLVEDLNPALWPVILGRARKISLGSLGVCTQSDLIFQLITLCCVSPIVAASDFYCH